MSILNQLNSVPMYAICGGIIAFVAVVCVIFLVRAYRTGKRHRHGYHENEAYDYFQRHVFPAAQCGNFAGSHCAVGKFGNSLALAASVRNRRPAL